MPAGPRIFVSAGEPSGDAHAAAVVRAVRRRWPDAVVEAFGGPALQAAGAVVRYPMEEYTVLGFLEAVGKIPAHLRLLRRLRRAFAEGRYDAVLLVDYPGFNLRLGASARRAGLRSLYYVAPQLWAWRAGRARHLRAAADRVAVILPFEAEFFRHHGIPTEFVGHPLTERSWPCREEARRAVGVLPGERVLALFPGSRRQEVDRIWPAFRDAARQLLAEGACHRVLVAAKPHDSYPGAEGIELHLDAADRLLAAADAALLKSGTTTLEAACAGTPMVVAYRVHPLTAGLARRVMTVPWVSLVNLVAGRAVVPELLQRRSAPGALADAVRPLLAPGGAAGREQRAGLREVRSRLGAPGASARVADILGELLAA
jgi:lipid-A-disaccharide synthase